MKFKTITSKIGIHKGTLTCLGWNNNDEVYSVSDDHQLYKWMVKSREPIQVAKLPDDFFPTDLHWLVARQLAGSSGGGGGVNSKGSDSLLITSTDGRFIILNKSARVERNIVAHTGPITASRWSPDGAGLLTAGEDGIVKVWSRSGMLRSTVVQNEEAIRCACWCPNSTAIAYCQSSFIAIKPLAANSKLIKWRAHDGLVLCLCWSNDTQLIASGGEDCRYKIWDAQGTVIFASPPEDYAITAIDFCPNGQLLAVGSFNLLKLCNFMGWTYSSVKFTTPSIGSLYSLAWSYDGTQIIAGTSSGTIVFGHVIDQVKQSKNLKATTTGRKSIKLEDITSQTTDMLDFPDRIIKWNIGYGHLAVATTSQVHIYNEKYTNTPLAIIDGRHDIRIIIMGHKYFLIIDNSSIWIYSYTGRLHLNPKYLGQQAQLYYLNEKCITLGLHYVAIRDYSDKTLIHIFDLIPGASSRQSDQLQIRSKTILAQIAVSRAGSQENQYIVFIDVNRDLFCTTIKNGSGEVATEAEIYKIGTQLQQCQWGSDSNILVGLHDSCYSIWYCPGEACADPTLISLTTLTFDTTEFGKNISLDNFEGSMITFKSAGTLYTIQVNLYCEILHRLLADEMWSQALKVCRRGQNLTLWATLAAMATKKNQLEISEESYAAALQIDKVNYLQHIKNLQNGSPEQMAEISIMMGRTMEAETILIHNKKISQAIDLFMRTHKWDRALDVAQKHEINVVQLVCDEREKYLKSLNKLEWNEKFLKLK